MSARYIVSALLTLIFSVGVTFGQQQYGQFIEIAQRYARKDLSMFRFDLTQRYPSATRESLDDYFARFGENWGDVVMAFSVSKASGRSMGEVLSEYDRSKPTNWNEITGRLGISSDQSIQRSLNSIIKRQLKAWHVQIGLSK